MTDCGLKDMRNVGTYLRMLQCYCHKGDSHHCTDRSCTCLARCIDHRSYCMLKLGKYYINRQSWWMNSCQQKKFKCSFFSSRIFKHLSGKKCHHCLLFWVLFSVLSLFLVQHTNATLYAMRPLQCKSPFFECIAPFFRFQLEFHDVNLVKLWTGKSMNI